MSPIDLFKAGVVFGLTIYELTKKNIRVENYEYKRF